MLLWRQAPRGAPAGGEGRRARGGESETRDGLTAQAPDRKQGQGCTGSVIYANGMDRPARAARI
jgi:hypothetical protein